MSPGPWWLVLWLSPLATLPAGTVREEKAALSAPRCKSLKETDLIKTSVSDCYCYNQNSQIEWTYVWSTVQVTVSSPGLLRFVYVTGSHNCQHPETILSFIKCVIHNFWAPEESKEMTMVFSPYGETVCFSVQPIGRVFTYAVSVDRNIVDFKLFLVFVAGIFLYFYAKTLSRSPVFYYSLGTTLGVLMTLVFVLLMCKRHIPKYSTFGALMAGCWLASVYAVCQLMQDLKRLWCGNRMYVLGRKQCDDHLTNGCVLRGKVAACPMFHTLLGVCLHTQELDASQRLSVTSKSDCLTPNMWITQNVECDEACSESDEGRGVGSDLTNQDGEVLTRRCPSVSAGL
ncbi:hypothetical protein STEG23_020108 [Scotinomys teguina]